MSGHAMVYDVVRHRIAVFGGWSSLPTAQPLNGEWVYGLPAPTHTTYGTGCRGSTGVPALSFVDLPWLNRVLRVRLSGARPLTPAALLLGSSGQVWLGLPLPYDLASFGAPSCTLFNSGEYSPGSTTDAQGSAEMPLFIPNKSYLTGLRLFAQFMVYDPGANALNAVFTQGGIAQIGGL